LLDTSPAPSNPPAQPKPKEKPKTPDNVVPFKKPDTGSKTDTGRTIVPVPETSRKNDKDKPRNIVYRGLNEQDDRNLKMGKGLIAGNPNGKASVTMHVVKGSQTSIRANSPYISTTEREDIARYKYGREHGYVIIDLDRVPSQKIKAYQYPFDLSTKDGRAAKRYATRDSEVLIKGYIPPSAIIDRRYDFY
jgi:hypothetical protein